MQATTQQALKWRWLSPSRIHAVFIAASPAFKSSAFVPPVSFTHLAGPAAWSGNFASPLAVSNKSNSCLASRPCTACRSSSNCPASYTGNSKHGLAWRRKSAIASLASAVSSHTVNIDNAVAVTPVRRPAAGTDGQTYPPECPTSTPVSDIVLDSGEKQDLLRHTPRVMVPTISHGAAYLPKATAGCFTGSPLLPARCGTGIGSITRALTKSAETVLSKQHHHRHRHHQHQDASTLAPAKLRQPALLAEVVNQLTVTAASTTASHSAAISLPTRHIVAAVDPDLNGALALIYWDVDPTPTASLRLPSPPPQTITSASSAVPGVTAGCSVGDTASSEPGTSFTSVPVILPAGQVGDADCMIAMPTLAGSAQGAAVSRGREAAVEIKDGDEGEERGGKEDKGEKRLTFSGGSNVAAAVWTHELKFPAPPAPPADPSLWTVRVWDMPVSAAELQKPTATGGISRRRLLHVAGARAMLASALASALPPPEEHRHVALYGYVEVPPILPGDGNISAYTSLWSTGAWLGLLTGMGFTVGSMPVRRWKQDMGLYGARSKDAGLALARVLFPRQARILKHKKNHGRADALLIAAWALGASLPPRLAGTLRRNHMTVDELLAEQPAVRLAWGPPRPPTPTDAYGNPLSPERDMMAEIEAAEARVDRLEEARAAKNVRRPRNKAAAAAAAAADADGNVTVVPAFTIMATSDTVRRPRRKKCAAAAAGAGGAAASTVAAGGEVEVAESGVMVAEYSSTGGSCMGGNEQKDVDTSGAKEAAPERKRKTKEAGRAPEAKALGAVDAAGEAAVAAWAGSSTYTSAPMGERKRGRGRPPKKVTVGEPADAAPPAGMALGVEASGNAL
ncbi:hypothetical protein VaNZ11_001775 [Volvox africanus]|uniref:Uncharacterized protein n=1 Tax=Volvox africanus TaxID=51714 RepID=A0ABQ5RRC8_9CHLO|nr:hypothetical protein VaNZ11_001775 [Volvox africanus]